MSDTPGLEPEVHSCEAAREGDWIVYRCPLCPDYERRINWRTGAMTARNVARSIRHRGSYVPAEWLEGETVH